MSNEQKMALPRTAPMKPPIPRWAYSVVNPTMKAILRSPFHGLLSKNLMELSFTGRKSGKQYRVPVGYTRDGNTLTLFSHAKWARNFEGGAPVVVRLEGTERKATARIIHDDAVIRSAIERMIRDRGEKMGEMMGFLDPNKSGPERLQLPGGTTFVEITLK